MEAAILKTTLAKNKAQEEQRADTERAHWQGQHGVKRVTAKPPEGGW